MKHYIYSIHACSASKWSKGYTEFYLTDNKNPTGKNPVKSVIVLQISETEEIFVNESYKPSLEVTVRLCRATYGDGHMIKEQRGYVFQLSKYDIDILLGMCQDKVDAFLEGKVGMEVNDSRYVNWNYKLPR